MYFGYLLGPPPPLCELARPAEWGFEYMFITGQSKRHCIIVQCYDNQSFKHCYKRKEHIQHSVVILCRTIMVLYVGNCFITE
jgi:hypothetical protein